MNHQLYEVSDARTIPQHLKVAAVAMVEVLPQPSRLHVWEYTGHSRTLPLEDDAFEWGKDLIIIYTKEGMVSFTPLKPGADILAFVDVPFELLGQNCLM
jgi:hypothetical protein